MRHLARSLVLVPALASALLSSTACAPTGEVEGNANEAPLSSDCAPGTSNVQGFTGTRWITPDGTVMLVPRDSNYVLSAVTGPATSPLRIEGRRVSGGETLIRCVPDGPFVLEERDSDTQNIVSAEVMRERTFTHVAQYSGYPIWREAAPNTRIRLNATNLLPVEEYISVNSLSGAFTFDIKTSPGALGMSRLLGEADGWFNTLPRAPLGTFRLFAHQRQPLNLPGIRAGYATVRTATKMMTIQEGAENLLDLTFVDGTPRTTHVSWNAELVDRTLGLGVRHPNLRVVEDFVAAWVEPRTGFPYWSGSAALFFLDTPTAPQVEADVAYVSGYDASWRASLSHWKSAFARLSNGVEASVGYRETRSDELNAVEDVQVRLSPVTNIRVNGQPASAPIGSATLTPTLTWDPPTVGNPTSYEVSIAEVVDGEREVSPRLFVTTHDPRLEILAGWLRPGVKYAFGVTAIADTDEAKLQAWETTDIVDPGVPASSPVTASSSTPTPSDPSILEGHGSRRGLHP